MARTTPPTTNDKEVDALCALLREKATEHNSRRIFLTHKELDKVLDEKGNINRIRHIMIAGLRSRNVIPLFTTEGGKKGYRFDVPDYFIEANATAADSRPRHQAAPEIQSPRENTGTITHFSTKYVIPDIFGDVKLAVKNNRRPIIIGPPGCGKSRMFEEIAASMGLEAIRRPLSQVADPAELTGYLHIKEENGVSVTKFVDGTITSCARIGKMLIFDEFDNATPAANEALKQITEEGGLLIVETEDGTEIIDPHPNFRICFTANTDCRGDSQGLFPNSEIQNRATLDRLRPKFFMGYQYEVERRVIADIGLPEAVLDALYNESPDATKRGLVQQIRETLKESGVADFLGFRAIIAFAEDFPVYGWNKSFLYHIVHDFDQEFQETVKNIVRSKLGSWAEPSRDPVFLKKHIKERNEKGFGLPETA